MRTSAIPYRVADFLKQHPPFQFMDEPDLVGLAARGRVKFHEPDEYICWQSSPHTPFLFVIQQGSVCLWDESADPPKLRDIFGPGDMVGMERFNGAAVSPYSAKTASEVIVYALDASDFKAIMDRYPRVSQFVAAQSVDGADDRATGERLQPHETRLSDLAPGRPALECGAAASIQDAARLLSESGAGALALRGEQGVAAVLTPSDVLRWAAAGAVDCAQPGVAIAGDGVIASPAMAVTDCILALAEKQAGAAAITEDGSRSGKLLAIVTPSDLANAFRDDPLGILRDIESAPGIESVRLLNDRSRRWLLEALSTPAAFDWLASWADLVNRRILERLIHLTGAGRSERLFCFIGAAGREEMLTAAAPEVVIIGDAAPELESAFAAVGYHSRPPLVCAGLEDWKARFSGWIRDPIETQVYLSRHYFDLRPVHGPAAAFQELESHIRAEVTATPAFLHIVANDCFATLPPLTFFLDFVVEESGSRSDTFHLESNAIEPLVDVGRVFHLAAGGRIGGSTRQRFAQAGRTIPAQEAIFREAAETVRLLLFHQARAGLRQGSTGADLPLATLGRLDRQVLKGGFRSIHDLLEYTVSCDWLEAV